MVKFTLSRIIAACVILTCIGIAGASYYFGVTIVRTFPADPELKRKKQGYPLPADLGLPQPESVELVAGGIMVQGFWFEAAGWNRCAVIISHGHSSNRYGAIKYAPLYWQRGCHILLPDLRGHGETQGDRVTYGYLEKQDLRAAMEWVVRRTGLSIQQIGLVGESLGAAISVQAGALSPQPAFLVLDSVFRSLSAIVSHQAGQRYGDWIYYLLPMAQLVAESLIGGKFASVSPEAVAPALEVPVILMHSKQDRFTPPEHSRAVARAMSHPRVFLNILDWQAEHGRLIDTRPAQYNQIIANILDRQVPGFWSIRTAERTIVH